ncbi:hypothetical protein J6590_090587 [Homalodisca vitripennis]|nr:hypothetical protein J6590_090587 [Homalodisca vitripennis]
MPVQWVRRTGSALDKADNYYGYTTKGSRWRYQEERGWSPTHYPVDHRRLDMLLCLLLCLLPVIVTVTEAQYPRPGDCPPALPVGVCYPSCSQDGQCEGFYKCCATACGGTVCSRPVTSRRFANLKSGVCPAKPTGPWVCSNRCAMDSDCRGRLKCCRNRCGALACVAPETAVMFGDYNNL